MMTQRGNGRGPDQDTHRLGTSRDLAFRPDYDRDRSAYDRPPSGPERHGRRGFADEERDAWRGRGAAFDPARDRVPSTARDPYGPQDDAREASQRAKDRTDWEPHSHGRAMGEHRYGSEYEGRDGRGAPQIRRPSGKGPKGYVRSDASMHEEICERLSAQGHDWSEVEVLVAD